MSLSRCVLAGSIIATCLVPLPSFAVDAPPPLAAPTSAPKSEPPAAGSWAWGILVPGLGQIAVGEPGRGIVTMGVATALPLTGLTVGALSMRSPYMMGWDMPMMIVVGALGLGLGAIAGGAVWGWGIADAYTIEQEKRAAAGLAPVPTPASPSPVQPIPERIPSKGCAP